jgi:acetyl esterase/lipase
MFRTLVCAGLAAALPLVFIQPASGQADAKAETKQADAKQVEAKKADPAKKAPPPRPTPTVADYAYAKDHERQRFDFWQAKSERPTPVVLLIHGGGWTQGDKTSYGKTVIDPYLEAGISVAAINYRFILQAMDQKVEPAVKGPLHDAARALQTIRSKAKEWNIDPQRIGATGGSAGACTSLWLALHNDLADPKSSDPVAQQSSRLQAAAVSGAQTSLDPKELREWMPNAIYGGHAFGFAAQGRKREQEFELLIANREKVLPWIKEYSPIELVSADDPPIYLDYPNQKTPPVVGTEGPDPTHSAIYGIKLLEKLKAANVEGVLAYPAQPDTKYGSIAKFLMAKLQAK